MKQLANKEELRRVQRQLDEAPSLVKWLFESREENRERLESGPENDIPELRGENKAINQILDKLPKEE